MQYAVLTVDDSELPDGVDRVIVERENEPPLLILAGEPARCWQWMRRWENTLEPPVVPTVCKPFPRAV